MRAASASRVRISSKENSGTVPLLFSLQYIRAIAALMVVFHHAREQIRTFEAMLPTHFGATGVSIFFVLSGFIIVVISAPKSKQAPMEFFASRVVRIAPMYWLSTFMITLVLLAAPNLFRETTFTWTNFLTSLFFIPNAALGHNSALTLQDMLLLIKVGWTLIYEMLFYIFFTAALFIAPSHRAKISASMIFATVAIGLAYQQAAGIEIFGLMMMLEFTFGMLLASLFLERGFRSIPPFFAWMMIVGGFGILLIAVTFFLRTPLLSGLGGVMILAGGLAIEQRGLLPKSRILLLLGAASYSIYLTHVFTLGGMRAGWGMLHLPTSGWAAAIVFLGASLAVSSLIGVATFWYVERPLAALAQAGIRALFALRLEAVSAPAIRTVGPGSAAGVGLSRLETT